MRGQSGKSKADLAGSPTARRAVDMRDSRRARPVAARPSRAAADL